MEVPDVSMNDGADAVTTLEGEGFSVTLADADEEPLFDTTRDATGCEVQDQDPAAGEFIAEGEEITVVVSCAQVDWENQEGAAWDAFDAAYSSGFDAGCDALFEQSPNGSLYEDDYEYSAIDCQNENPGDGSEASDVPQEVPTDPEAAGTEVGELDGCQALFENQSVWSLNYGTDSWTESDCPISSTAAGPVERKKTAKHSTAKQAGDSCKITQTDGAAMTVEIGDGRVNCSGAEALWNEYLRRAPSEGIGSGAAVQLEGWACIAAPAAQAPRAGSCSATDSSGSFTVITGT
ncbi:PASTA domain-containing protein [Solirubrobacter taibaiensis]|nr:PASTA domain-containing protein [Solirubrobacter taibaiensis]